MSDTTKAKPPPISPASSIRRSLDRIRSHWAVRMMVVAFVLDGTVTTCSSLANGERPPIADRAIDGVDWLSQLTGNPPDLPSVELGS